MSPHLQPCSLFQLCIKSCLKLVDFAGQVIVKNYPWNDFVVCEGPALELRNYLLSILPIRLFDILCAQRTCSQYNGERFVPESIQKMYHVQFHALTHPKMTVLCRCDFDSNLPELFWLSNLHSLNCLVVLDLRFICTDKILKVIGPNCPLLEEINIVSKVNILKCYFNATVMVRNVSDEGLVAISNLKRLKILAMDPPRSETTFLSPCITQTGILFIITELPNLEELRIESCDIGSTLSGIDRDIGPLRLKKVNCHSASSSAVNKLVNICPMLNEISLTYLSNQNKDRVLDEITSSNLMLNKISLSFFSFSASMQQLLTVKGVHLTHFSLWETDHTMTLNSVLTLGFCCPNLNTLYLMTQSKQLLVSSYFRRPKNIFTKLRSLTIGNDNFNILHILTFFIDCTTYLEKLALKYQSKTDLDEILLHMLQKSSFRTVNHIWLDCTLAVSKQVVLQVIQHCDNLQIFTVDIEEEQKKELRKFICENNLDLRLGSY